MDDRQLDRALDAWGRMPLGEEAAVARIVSHADAVPSARPGRRWLAWGAGGALAASLAWALLMTPALHPDTPPAGMEPVASAADASFAMLYSTTADEEILL